MIVNAKIKRTELGVEDHGIMSFTLFCEWPGAGCGFGGYGLDAAAKDKTKRRGCGHSYQAIRLILETLGVQCWEKLPGTLIRVEDEGPGGQLKRIGHIMEDRWFDISEYMNQRDGE